MIPARNGVGGELLCVGFPIVGLPPCLVRARFFLCNASRTTLTPGLSSVALMVPYAATVPCMVAAQKISSGQAEAPKEGHETAIGSAFLAEWSGRLLIFANLRHRRDAGEDRRK